jgi:Ca-activated chloride channel family protein
MAGRGHWPTSGMRAAMAAAAVALGAGPPTALGQEAPAAVVVFDNSGSMWGKLEGAKENKLGVARAALETALPRLRAGVRTGLVTFGRRRGDCADIEVVARPEAGDADRITAPLDRLNPKGRGPIVQATREAVKAIGSARPASVILIHDDPDNCQQDPCAAAADFKREQPGVRVHLVSIALKREDTAKMSCLAETTGGRVFEVQTAPQLTAAIAEALGLAAGEVGKPPPAPVPVVRPAAPETAKAAAPAGRVGRKPSLPPKDGAPGLWLSAVLSAGSDLVEGPVAWKVLKSSGGVEAVVFEALGSEVRAELPAGGYVVEAKFGLATSRKAVEVMAGAPTPAVVALEAGALRLVARAQSAGPAIDQIVYAVHAGGPGEAGKPAESPLWIGRDPEAAVGLPPGTYRVVAERGFARAEKAVTITAGQVADADLVLGAGLLTLRAAAREDGDALPDAQFILAAEDPQAPQGHRELTRSAASVPDFVVPAGSYMVTARIGGSEVRERVSVGAGESVKRTIILGLGKLTISARLEQIAGQPAWREAVNFRVVRRDGDQREVARTSVSPATLELPTGAYRVEAQVGAQNAMVVRDIDLQAGRTTQLALELPAARAGLKLAEGLAGSGEIAWDVRDESGRSIWRGMQSEPRLVLAPGRYTVRVSVRDKRLERALALRSGEARIIEIGPE